MNSGLILSEILLSFIVVIAAILAVSFGKSKSNKLAKLMKMYFWLEVFIHAASATYFLLVDNGVTNISIGMFRLFVLIPKGIMMAVIIAYLRNNKN